MQDDPKENLNWSNSARTYRGVFGVIGDPIEHSQSPAIHQFFAREEHRDLDYRPFLVSKEGLTAFIQLFFASGGRGLNVTAPHKQAVLDCVKNVLPRAREARSANTLLLDSAGELCADNTDGYGLFKDFERLGIKVSDQRVLLLGAGGAVSGLLSKLVSAEPQQLTIINRNLSKAETLASWFPDKVRPLDFSIDQIKEVDLIINGLSAGLESLRQRLHINVNTTTIAYDLNYGSRSKAFTDWMLSIGCVKAYDGLGMLWHQAAEAYRLWHGHLPSVDSKFR